MKRYITIMLTVFIVISSVLPVTALAANETEDCFCCTGEEFEAFNPIYADYEESSDTRATGLIIEKNLAIAKSGSLLFISGYTYGNSEVVKCGFKKVVVQRRTSSSTSWSNYMTYDNLYSESTRYTLNKSLSVASGYQYRVTAVHYAKKSLLSTQKIEATTGYLTF